MEDDRTTGSSAGASGGETGLAKGVALVIAAGAGFLALLTWFLPFRPVSIYPEAARQLVEGKLPPERILDWSPFYLHLHAAARLWSPAYPRVLAAVEALAVAGAAAAVFALAARLAGKRWGFVGAAALLLSPGAVSVSRLFLPDVWILLFTSLAILAASSCAERPRTFVAFAAGAASGLSFLVRPTAVLLLPALAAAVGLPAGRRVRRLALLFLGPAAAFLLILARNGAVLGRIEPTVMSAGANFYLGNNPQTGTGLTEPPFLKEAEEEARGGVDYEHVLFRRWAQAALGRPVSSGESAAWWARKAVAFLTDNPRETLRRAVVKLRVGLGTYELPDSVATHLLSEELSIHGVPYLVPFSVLAAAGLAGLLFLRATVPLRVMLLLGVAGILAGMTIFSPSAKYRLPILPLLAVLAATLPRSLRERFRDRPRHELAAVTAGVVVLAILLSIPCEAERRHRHTWDALWEASRLRAEAANLRNVGKRADARAVVAVSIAEAPFWASRLLLANLPWEGIDPLVVAVASPASRDSDDRVFDRALLLVETRRADDARPLLKQLSASGGRFDRFGLASPSPDFHLGRLSLLAGRLPEAAALFRRALARCPGDPESLAYLAAVERTLGLEIEAARTRETLFRYVAESDAHLYLSRALRQVGDSRAAATEAREAARLLPELRRPHLELMEALAASGREEEAAAELSISLSIREEPLWPGETPAACSLAAAQKGGSAAGWAFAARVLRLSGRWSEARAAVDEAVLRDPTLPAALAERKFLEHQKGPGGGP